MLAGIYSLLCTDRGCVEHTRVHVFMFNLSKYFSNLDKTKEINSQTFLKALINL